MKVEFINPFTEAAAYVIGEVLRDNAIERGQLALKDDPHITRGIATIVGITGTVRGHVIYDMEKKTAVEIASIMNGEQLFGLDNIVRSTINELANMISGHAASKLVAAGYRCDITPPTFIVGEESEFYTAKGISHLVVPFVTKAGRVTISVALTEAV